MSVSSPTKSDLEALDTLYDSLQRRVRERQVLFGSEKRREKKSDAVRKVYSQTSVGELLNTSSDSETEGLSRALYQSKSQLRRAAGSKSPFKDAIDQLEEKSRMFRRLLKKSVVSTLQHTAEDSPESSNDSDVIQLARIQLQQEMEKMGKNAEKNAEKTETSQLSGKKTENPANPKIQRSQQKVEETENPKVETFKRKTEAFESPNIDFEDQNFEISPRKVEHSGKFADEPSQLPFENPASNAESESDLVVSSASSEAFERSAVESEGEREEERESFKRDRDSESGSSDAAVSDKQDSVHPDELEELAESVVQELLEGKSGEKPVEERVEDAPHPVPVDLAFNGAFEVAKASQPTASTATTQQPVVFTFAYTPTTETRNPRSISPPTVPRVADPPVDPNGISGLSRITAAPVHPTPTATRPQEWENATPFERNPSAITAGNVTTVTATAAAENTARPVPTDHPRGESLHPSESPVSPAPLLRAQLSSVMTQLLRTRSSLPVLAQRLTSQLDEIVTRMKDAHHSRLAVVIDDVSSAQSEIRRESPTGTTGTVTGRDYGRPLHQKAQRTLAEAETLLDTIHRDFNRPLEDVINARGRQSSPPPTAPSTERAIIHRGVESSRVIISGGFEAYRGALRMLYNAAEGMAQWLVEVLGKVQLFPGNRPVKKSGAGEELLPDGVVHDLYELYRVAVQQVGELERERERERERDSSIMAAVTVTKQAEEIVSTFNSQSRILLRRLCQKVEGIYTHNVHHCTKEREREISKLSKEKEEMEKENEKRVGKAIQDLKAKHKQETIQFIASKKDEFEHLKVQLNASKTMISDLESQLSKIRAENEDNLRFQMFRVEREIRNGGERERERLEVEKLRLRRKVEEMEVEREREKRRYEEQIKELTERLNAPSDETEQNESARSNPLFAALHSSSDDAIITIQRRQLNEFIDEVVDAHRKEVIIALSEYEKERVINIRSREEEERRAINESVEEEEEMSAGEALLSQSSHRAVISGEDRGLPQVESGDINARSVDETEAKDVDAASPKIPIPEEEEDVEDVDADDVEMLPHVSMAPAEENVPGNNSGEDSGSDDGSEIPSGNEITAPVAQEVQSFAQWRARHASPSGNNFDADDIEPRKSVPSPSSTRAESDPCNNNHVAHSEQGAAESENNALYSFDQFRSRTRVQQLVGAGNNSATDSPASLPDAQQYLLHENEENHTPLENITHHPPSDVIHIKPGNNSRRPSVTFGPVPTDDSSSKGVFPSSQRGGADTNPQSTPFVDAASLLFKKKEGVPKGCTTTETEGVGTDEDIGVPKGCQRGGLYQQLLGEYTRQYYCESGVKSLSSQCSKRPSWRL